ncbi:pirin family protein [Bacillus sp. M6-12]|uniref:pirin family protein n=1 Tax=Bacillus sp. M6-12 TaxID=2054166 RepID=UPI000C7938D0|nr:pirin family protein [Bacillus sp. M6-12]PLS18142.1 pirin family protein [Bacillus sp. M6-12]
MNTEHVFLRGIKSVRDVTYQQNSDTHKVGLVIEPGYWEQHDPFLLLAEDWFQKGTFPVHPHRGIETVTYVIEGKLEHFDNKAGRGELLPGDVQWMTAGRGVLHSEDPAEGETVHSLQLWVNLPSEQKMTEPRYQNLRSQDMPVRKEDGAVFRVFSGSSKEIISDTKNHIPVTMVEMTLEPGATVTQDLPGDYNGFLYIIEGNGKFGIDEVEGKKGQVLWLEQASNSEMSEVKISAQEHLKAVLYAGRPVRERVVARGPFVMNTEEEVRQAYRDYMEGKFK